MDGFFNPVGPEPTGTYWVRRGLVIVGLLLVVALVVAVVKAFFGSDRQQASPADVATSPASSVTLADSVTPTESVPPSTSASSAASTKPAATPGATTSAQPKSAPPKSAPPKSAPPKSTPSPKVVACEAGTVRVAVTGPSSISIGNVGSLSVGVTNASAATCLFDPRAAAFELRVYSGTDRIWSTLDCPTGVPQKPVALAPAKAQVWKFSWPTQRSAAGCKLTNNLRPGTYVATVVADQATPAQHVMQLR